MPRVGWVKPQGDQRLSDHIALGVLTRSFPPSLVDAAIEAAGKAERRHRLLPARLVVYYVLALALFSDAGYKGDAQLGRGSVVPVRWKTQWEVPTKGVISQARARLGAAPLKGCFEAACVPMATETTPGAFYRSWRLMAIDGTDLDVPDTAANDEELGRQTPARGEGSAFPQVRLVGLGECGTHALCAVAIGSYDTGESTLATELVGALSPGMLVLADRGFGGSYTLLSAMRLAERSCCGG